MEWEDEAYVLSARAHGETGAIVELLTASQGKFAAHVAGGASRRMKPFLQAGARVIARYRSRTSDQLGSATLEPVGEGPAALFDDPLALSGLAAAAAVAAQHVLAGAVGRACRAAAGPAAATTTAVATATTGHTAARRPVTGGDRPRWARTASHTCGIGTVATVHAVAAG